MASKTTKKKPGRPLKPAGEKPEQFSIRLSPKLKFGLELLSRAQGRSLSQAIEWAVQIGLNNFRGTNTGSIANLLDAVWDKAPVDRYIAVWEANPALLSFEDAATCELILRSQERFKTHSALDLRWYEHDADLRSRSSKAVKLMQVKVFNEFVAEHYTTIRVGAVVLSTSGQSLGSVSILKLLGYEFPELTNIFSVMKAITEISRGELPEKQMAKRISELSKKFFGAALLDTN